MQLTDTSPAAPNSPDPEELAAFIRETGITPVTVHAEVVAEIESCLQGDLELDAILEQLRSPDVLRPIEERSGGCFCYHPKFRQLMLSTEPLVAYRAYMKIWLGGELFLYYPEQYDKLPAAFRRSECP